MDRLESMIDKIECALHKELDEGIEKIDTREYGKVIDILKDLYMCRYYETVVESMKNGDMQMAMNESGMMSHTARM